MKKTPKKVYCDFCSNEITRFLCRTLKFKTHFCSRECHVFFQKKNAFNFPCKICSTPIFTQPTQLKLRARSTCSPKCRRELRKTKAEEKHLQFGYTKHQIDRIARCSAEAIEWRKSVFERDDFTCQECKIRGTYLEADHIKPWAYFPKLRFDLFNGRTLCRPCHNKTKIGYKKMRKIYA